MNTDQTAPKSSLIRVHIVCIYALPTGYFFMLFLLSADFFQNQLF